MITEDKINVVLQDKVNILTHAIICKLPKSPQAIYLVGGYGRGEGAWYEDGDGIHPYNDFDIAVITNTPLSCEATEILRKELAFAVGIKWVDIDYYSIETLHSLTTTIHNVDLLEGASLIYGEDVIKNLGLKMNPKSIGQSDLITLYWTRMWTFLGSWQGSFRKLNVEDARFFKNQMAKAVLAACDMRLVKLKKYTTSYRKRAEIITQEHQNNKNLCDLVSWAIHEKMRPSSNEMGANEMTELYFRVKDEFISAFNFSFGKRAVYFLVPNKTKSYYLFHTKRYLFHLYSLLIYNKSNIVRCLDVFYAMNYIFHANKLGDINIAMLKKASKLLMKHGYINQPIISWDELRILSAHARNNI